MKTAKITAALLILVFLFIFSVYNSQSVEIAFVNYRSPAFPLFLVVLFVFVLGAIVTGLLGAIRVSQLRRRNQLLQKELDALNRNPGTSPDGASEAQ